MTALELELLKAVAGDRVSFTPEPHESPNHPTWRRRVRALEQLHAYGYISDVLARPNTRTNEGGIYVAVVNGSITETGRQALEDAARELAEIQEVERKKR